jgi:hypothetical protein
MARRALVIVASTVLVDVLMVTKTESAIGGQMAH